ncbi:MAG TPA: hypothetical protein VLS93_12830 [Anaeromyxobacteraceae bacterium]|nr:hypothetical protein [Anaeromyxobacteraceae bacterium]
MLARLDRIPGVLAARADASGRLFLLDLGPGAGEAAVREAAVRELGGDAVPATAEAAAIHLARLGRGDPWYRAGEAAALAFVEARVLAARIGDGPGREAGLAPPERLLLADEAYRELAATFERWQAEDPEQAARFFEHWPDVAARIAERVGAALGGARGAEVAGALARFFG